MKVHRESTPRVKPTKPIIVYYKEHGTGRVCSGYISHRRGDEIVFTDDQWNPAEDCFLTPQQATKFGTK